MNCWLLLLTKIDSTNNLQALPLDIGGLYCEMGETKNSLKYLAKAILINPEYKNDAKISSHFKKLWK